MMIEWIERLDKIIFLFIHHDSDQKVLDHFFPLLRNALTWIPLYAFLLYFSVVKFKKAAWLFVLLTIATVAICDQLSAGWLKPLFERPRPCFDAELQPFIRNLINCGGMYSFPSSHAANHFGLAAFWYYTIYLKTRKKWHWLWVWAMLIGYAQIYVGKHFPLDIIGGSILGFIIGVLMAKLFEYLPFFIRQFAKDPLHGKSLET